MSWAFGTTACVAMIPMFPSPHLCPTKLLFWTNAAFISFSSSRFHFWLGFLKWTQTAMRFRSWPMEKVLTSRRELAVGNLQILSTFSRVFCSSSQKKKQGVLESATWGLVYFLMGKCTWSTWWSSRSCNVLARIYWKKGATNPFFGWCSVVYQLCPRMV